MSLLKSRATAAETHLQIVNEFLNVHDIADTFLYTKDEKIFAYLKLQPMTLDLLSNDEKKRKIRRFSAEFGGIKETFKFFATSRPVDISRTTHYLAEIMQNTENPFRKKILYNDIQAISNFALSGEVIQRQFYLIIWESTVGVDIEKIKIILLKRIGELASKLKACDIDSTLIDETAIIQLCNLFTNPAYVHIENTSYEMFIPKINMEDANGEKKIKKQE